MTSVLRAHQQNFKSVYSYLSKFIEGQDIDMTKNEKNSNQNDQVPVRFRWWLQKEGQGIYRTEPNLPYKSDVLNISMWDGCQDLAWLN